MYVCMYVCMYVVHARAHLHPLRGGDFRLSGSDRSRSDLSEERPSFTKFPSKINRVEKKYRGEFFLQGNF